MERARLLVVDDSLTIRRALEVILKPRGYAVEFAADGREAIDRADSFRPDLVLLDYVLPDMRGPDVCAALSLAPASAETPVILVSAKGASIRKAYQDAHNVVSYITKPFKPQVVLSVVENALEHHRSTASEPTPKSDSTAGRSVPRPGLRSATIEETFSALLEQLEDTVWKCTLRTGRNADTPAQLVDPLRRAREQLRRLDEHVEDEAVSPLRLHADGSLANLASTLLETHRLLCEIALSLATTGTPGSDPIDSPRTIVAVPTTEDRHQMLSTFSAARNHVLFVDRNFGCLPWLVHLLAPRLLIAVPGADRKLDVVLKLPSIDTVRRIALVDPGSLDDTEAWRNFEKIANLDELSAALDETVVDAAGIQSPPPVGLEVVSL